MEEDFSARFGTEVFVSSVVESSVTSGIVHGKKRELPESMLIRRRGNGSYSSGSKGKGWTRSMIELRQGKNLYGKGRW